MLAMLRPIPKSVLHDTALVRVSIPDTDAYDGRGSFGAPVEIKNVRFQSREEMRASQYVFADGSIGLLFVDRVNSIGAFEIKPGDLVTLRGEERTAVKTTPLYGEFGVIHHWEVELR